MVGGGSLCKNFLILSVISSTLQWSKLYKSESITPVPNALPPKSPDELRNISGLLTFNKVAERMIPELMIADMTKSLDP